MLWLASGDDLVKEQLVIPKKQSRDDRCMDNVFYHSNKDKRKDALMHIYSNKKVSWVDLFIGPA